MASAACGHHANTWAQRGQAGKFTVCRVNTNFYRVNTHSPSKYKLQNTSLKIHAPKYRPQNTGSKDIGYKIQTFAILSRLGLQHYKEW